MGYEWDVFLSYPRNPDLEEWIKTYFVPRLYNELKEQTLYQCGRNLGKIFFDVAEIAGLRSERNQISGIELGSDWQKKIEEVIPKTRCMVGIWSNTYFRSEWCLLEWRSFMKREPKTSVPIIIPLSLVKINMLPVEAKRYQVTEIYEFVIDGPSFYESRLFPDFLALMRKIAEPIAKAICKAPDYEDWEIDRAGEPQQGSIQVARF